MPQVDTVDKILDAAELLFAEKGFSETSLRMITSKANVNLAAVNYHFGSKNALIQAVFSRFLGPLSKSMEQASFENGWGKSKIPSLEDILKLYTHSLLKLPSRHENGVAIFMRLMGLAYTQSQGHLRRYLEQEYSKSFRLFLELIKLGTPELGVKERFWRTQFTLGSIAFTMSSIQPLTEILENSKSANGDPEEVVNLLVPYMVSGLTAPPVDVN